MRSGGMLSDNDRAPAAVSDVDERGRSGGDLAGTDDHVGDCVTDLLVGAR